MMQPPAPLGIDRRQWLTCCLALGIAGPAASATPGGVTTFKLGDDPAASPVWAKVRASLFEGREALPAPEGALLLEAPMRAIDAAVVPVAVRARLPAGVELRRLALIIDANPSPISGLYRFAAGVREPFIETRVRVDGYTHMRAIAELADGRLWHVTRFVRAAGGCSAPPGGDAALQAANLGKLRLRAPAHGSLQLDVGHPNHSGMAMDQLTRQFTPADFVRQVEVSAGDRMLFAADVDFSISENPSFRFAVPPLAADQALRVQVQDSSGRQFELREVTPGAGGAR